MTAIYACDLNVYVCVNFGDEIMLGGGGGGGGRGEGECKTQVNLNLSEK